MKKKEKRTMYIVDCEILPEAIKRTAYAKELIAQNKVRTINEAVEIAGISRSAFYKYREGIFPFYEAGKRKIITVSATMENRSGVLSSFLNQIASAKGNILTINQSIPLQGIAYVTVSMETDAMEESPELLMESLDLLEGVQKVELISQS